ncbi:hypothetical protein BD560DRAFT_426792 [Blakeslea trispora]|nr:hypothetical protein BD560DRAFT_426792 [Blakeslea trispora]
MVLEHAHQQKSAALVSQWVGPFRIEQIVGHDVYRVKDGELTLPIAYHVNQMKLYKARSKLSANLKYYFRKQDLNDSKHKQPIEVEYNLPYKYNPNKRRFKPQLLNKKRKKTRLNLISMKLLPLRKVRLSIDSSRHNTQSSSISIFSQIEKYKYRGVEYYDNLVVENSDLKHKQPIEIEYNLPFMYNPNKKRFKPQLLNKRRKKTRLNLICTKRLPFGKSQTRL